MSSVVCIEWTATSAVNIPEICRVFITGSTSPRELPWRTSSWRSHLGRSPPAARRISPSSTLPRSGWSYCVPLTYAIRASCHFDSPARRRYPWASDLPKMADKPRRCTTEQINALVVPVLEGAWSSAGSAKQFDCGAVSPPCLLSCLGHPDVLPRARRGHTTSSRYASSDVVSARQA